MKSKPANEHLGKEFRDKRISVAIRDRLKSLAGRDIAPIPPVKSPKRKSACEPDLELFLRTYFPLSYTKPWSTDHREVIAVLQEAITTGGQFAYAMPRASGKTTIVLHAACWALLYGHRDFVPLIAGDASAAESLLESIKSELETNPLLFEDFPEVCYPIRQLEGIALRCAGQLFEGKRTHMAWTASEIVLPTIPGSKASAGVVRVSGITGGIRGMQFTRPDGRKVRPSFAIVDDPQTNESASSPSQVNKRLKTIEGSILGLAGPGVPMACVVTCTVIEAGDVADQLLDQRKRPDWRGKRAKLMYAFPKNDRLWEQYSQIRADSLRANNGGKEATAFYIANREAMDEGAHPAWPARFNPDEVSAIQHAMNLRIKMGPDRFDAEYQNDPPKRDIATEQITPEEITERMNRVPRRVVPVETRHLVAMIDVQGDLLFYTVVGVANGFGAAVIDFGSYPEQNRTYFTLADSKRKLSVQFPGMSRDAAIYAGLEALVEDLAGREWRMAGGGVMKMAGILIDANWGPSTDLVYKFCRQSKYANLLMPSHGKYVGAAGKPMSQFKRGPGETIGEEWMIPSVKGKRAIRHVLIDTNYWKAFLMTRLAAPIGDASAMTFFGDRPDALRMIADHICSEYGIPVEGRGRKVIEFKSRATHPENHLLDCLVGCLVRASMLGVTLTLSQTAGLPKPKPQPKRNRVRDMF